jgi:hypothetical protein
LLDGVVQTFFVLDLLLEFFTFDQQVPVNQEGPAGLPEAVQNHAHGIALHGRLSFLCGVAAHEPIIRAAALWEAMEDLRKNLRRRLHKSFTDLPRAIRAPAAP